MNAAHWTLIILIVAFFAMWGMSEGHRWAKADATWIMEQHPECCGPEDCEPAMGKVRFDKDGWATVDGLDGRMHPTEIKESKDGLPWACRYPYMEGVLRCLFLPKRPLLG